jgi:hypothetical protein
MTTRPRRTRHLLLKPFPPCVKTFRACQDWSQAPRRSYNRWDFNNHRPLHWPPAVVSNHISGRKVCDWLNQSQSCTEDLFEEHVASLSGNLPLAQRVIDGTARCDSRTCITNYVDSSVTSALSTDTRRLSAYKLAKIFNTAWTDSYRAV